MHQPDTHPLRQTIEANSVTTLLIFTLGLFI